MADKRTCAACGHTESLAGPRWSHSCPQNGKPSGRTCPSCSAPTVWRSGVYGTFHGCSNFQSTGCRGKVNAPRGKNAAKAPQAEPSYDDAPSEAQTDDSNPNPSPTSNPEPIIVTPAPSPTAPVPTNDPGAALWAMIQAYATQAMADLARKAAEEAASLVEGKNVTVTFKVGDATLGTVDPTMHSKTKEALECNAAGFNNLFICGPAGSGKTTMARDLAKALKRPFVAISCSAGMSESKIEGRTIPRLSDGEEIYRSSKIVEGYRDGAVILFDEVDAADPNTLLVLNAASANGHWFVPNGEITRHPDTVLIFGANTWGSGADRMYVGRNQLDAAFLDRFVGAQIDVDYDQDIEKRILPDAKALARVWKVREQVQALKLRRIVGTRFVQAVAKWTSAGKTVDQALEICTRAWTPDERSKVGVTK